MRRAKGLSSRPKSNPHERGGEGEAERVEGDVDGRGGEELAAASSDAVATSTSCSTSCSPPVEFCVESTFEFRIAASTAAPVVWVEVEAEVDAADAGERRVGIGGTAGGDSAACEPMSSVALSVTVTVSGWWW